MSLLAVGSIQAAPWPNVRLWGGGVPHPDSADSTPRISYPLLMPPTQGISMPLGRRKTLALAQMLQACIEELGVPADILYELER